MYFFNGSLFRKLANQTVKISANQFPTKFQQNNQIKFFLLEKT